MTAEEEVIDLRQEKSLLQEQLAQRDELIAHMQHELVLLREQVHALQEQLNKDSHNSHLPPSSDRFHRQSKSLRKSSGKKPGGQAGHPGRTLMLSPTPDTVLVHPVDWCQHCQRDVHEVESLDVERRQVLDLPPKRMVVIEHQAKCCPRCQQISSAPFPQDVCGPVQYGAAVGAVGIYLVEPQLLPYERACEVMENLLGCLMSERGQEALDAIGILVDFQGVSVHDGWRSYWQFLCQHALCNAHHLRELTFLEEEQQQPWAAEMKELLLDMKAAVEQARAEGRSYLHPLEVVDWKARYAALLAEGYQANPPDPPPEISRPGRRKQSAARNLLDRLSTHQEAVLLFLDNFAVPFDNSLAERDMRMVKVQQKISGCFRSEAIAVAFCRIRGYLSTLRKQAMAVLTALEQILVGHPVSPAF